MKPLNPVGGELPPRPENPGSMRCAADALAEVWALGGFDIETVGNLAPDALIVIRTDLMLAALTASPIAGSAGLAKAHDSTVSGSDTGL